MITSTEGITARPTGQAAQSLSVLLDGQMQADALASVVDQLYQDPRVRPDWYSYHLVGEVLRTGQSLSYPGDAELLARIAQTLSLEAPYSQAPIATDLIAKSPDLTGAKVEFLSRKPAANDARFSWQMAGGLATVMIFAWLGWQVGAPWADHARNAQLAEATLAAPVPGSLVAPVSAATLLRDPHLDAVLQAQRSQTGTTVSPGPSGRVRNASFQGAGR